MSWEVDTDEVIGWLNGHLGRPAPAYEAVLKIMQANVPAVMADLGFDDRTVPKVFQFAGEDLGDLSAKGRWPKLLVGGSIRTEDFGSGHQDEAMLAITCAYPVPIGPRAFIDALDVACVARGIMRHPRFAGQCVDPDDATRCFWGHCLPGGFRIVPADWEHYSGWIAEFTFHQYPGGNLWQSTP